MISKPSYTFLVFLLKVTFEENQSRASVITTGVSLEIFPQILITTTSQNDWKGCLCFKIKQK